jgi:hypothetical protein
MTDRGFVLNWLAYYYSVPARTAIFVFYLKTGDLQDQRNTKQTPDNAAEASPLRVNYHPPGVMPMSFRMGMFFRMPARGVGHAHAVFVGATGDCPCVVRARL